MTTKNSVIEQFLHELNCKSNTAEETSFGTVEELRRFALREGYLKEEKQDTKD